MDNEDVEAGEVTEISEEELKDLVESMLGNEPASSNWSSHSLAYYGTDSRSIILSGEIDERLAAGICSQILELSKIDEESPITVHINTPGGNIIDALGIYDTLLCVPNPIITMVVGGAFSAGVLIAVAGDIRLTTPNSMYFYHQPIMQVMGIDSSEAIESSHEFYKWSKSKISELVRTRAGINKRTWQKEFANKTSKYFDASEAVRYGIATNILAYSKKPKMKIEE